MSKDLTDSYFSSYDSLFITISITFSFFYFIEKYYSILNYVLANYFIVSVPSEELDNIIGYKCFLY